MVALKLQKRESVSISNKGIGLDRNTDAVMYAKKARSIFWVSINN